MSGESYHSQQLCKHCRICGGRFIRQHHKTEKNTMRTMMKTCYHIDVNNDHELIHPPEVCYRCVCLMKRTEKAQGAAFFNPAGDLFTWKSHTQPHCDVCEHFRVTAAGGRPKKDPKNRGRPFGETASQTIEALSKVAGKAVVKGVNPARLVAAHVRETNVICSACNNILDSPIQLSCEHLACHQCLCERLVADGQETHCPGCNERIVKAHLKKCPAVVMDIIENLKVRCKFESKKPL